MFSGAYQYQPHDCDVDECSFIDTSRLSGVVRNTAVRRTQREKSIRDLEAKHKRAKSSKVTTVYFNSRGPTSDIQTMSPSKLHHQVADILSALNQSDDEDGPPFKR
ncbi:hypothetical protein DPMN_175902 [Dreissena polymorpha]|uniref:Uncharacterized protein n=1 Tax=Dreissena polymorpha TaxID=45954 RepID=A0A9D4E8M3_DREPO|nr:hypothetical protein DPMN_175902 [Dreissena polymorpha]